jgi:hypothetical protein
VGEVASIGDALGHRLRGLPLLCTTTPAHMFGHLEPRCDDLPPLGHRDGTPVEVPDHVGLTAGHDRFSSRLVVGLRGGIGGWCRRAGGTEAADEHGDDGHEGELPGQRLKHCEHPAEVAGGGEVPVADSGLCDKAEVEDPSCSGGWSARRTDRYSGR